MNARDLLKSLPHPIDETFHGATDYMVGAGLMTWMPRMLGVQGTTAGRQLRMAGAFHAGYSMVTDYPLGITRRLPYRAHLAIDAGGALALAALPLVTGQWRRGRSQWLPHLGLAVFELGAVLLSDPTGRGSFHGDIGAVQAANMESPEAKIHQGGPAVRRAAA